MSFILYHWHCIVPAAAILIGILLMRRDKRKDDGERVDHNYSESYREGD